MTRVLLAIVLAVSLGSQQDRQPARFRSGTDAVRVDVLARRGNQPITGLTAGDFELRDTGVVQEIRAVATEDVPVTLLLALDTSGSVQGPMLDNLKAAARSAVGALGPDDEAALLTFTQKVRRQGATTSDRAGVHAAIDRMGALGSTSMNDAIFTAIALGEQPDRRVVLLVFTDGLDNSSWLQADQVLDAAGRTNIVVYSVSISSLFVATSGRDSMAVIRRRAALRRWFEAEPDLFPQGLLDELSDRTGGEAFYVRDGGEVAPAFARIISSFKTRYLLIFSPRNVPASGWHPIEVKLKKHRGTIQARRGYWR
jgi:Ca-activated chloride channel family protein